MSTRKSNFFLFFSKISRILGMTEVKGYTLKELADELKIPQNRVTQRLHVAGIKPLVREAIYPASALEAIRNVPGRGRPPKKPDK
jgi:predicted ArsR family transcriptional regulator